MKIAVLVSGGVDSSVALQLLKNEGHEVEAFYLKIWLEDELSFLGDCPWEEDTAYLETICKKLSVPLHTLSLQREYLNTIVAYTVQEVKAGRTPNPDVLCNQQIKFGAFYGAIDASFEKVATGHYAQVEEKEGKFYLKQAPDPIKDQSYFLSSLSQAQLKRACFPIGHLQKKEVRALAEKYDLANKDRKDSQGLCFLGKIKYSDFIKAQVGIKVGDIIEAETGKKLGEHEGFYLYTRGQRKGIKLSGGPYYVVDKDADKNIVYVSKEYFSEDKDRSHCTIQNINWIPEAYSLDTVEVKIRHGAKSLQAKIQIAPDTKSATIHLPENDQGLASGQFIVMYQNGYCIGNGVIA